MNANAAVSLSLPSLPISNIGSDAKPLSQTQLSQAKTAFALRRVDLADAEVLLSGDRIPSAGDLVLARVDRIRQHTRIELRSGRRSNLFVGDTVVLAYGNRYATDQFEARVPDDLSPCHMVAAGGLAAAMVSRNAGIKPATEITPLGLIADAQQRVLNLRDYQLNGGGRGAGSVPVIAVMGSSMNAGKTTTAACLINGMVQAGKKVAAVKITGTGSGGDLWKMRDAGAFEAIDFSDAGYISTDRVPLDEILDLTDRLLGHLAAKQPDVIIVEVADGLFQPQTAALLTSRHFQTRVNSVLFASGDILGAVAGANILRNNGFRLLGLAGVLTRSELAVREVQQSCDVPVYSLLQLQDPQQAELFIHQAKQSQQRVCREA
ncbi:MAG: hypothetical protein V7752_07915 [Halopseudomonas sp.]